LKALPSSIAAKQWTETLCEGRVVVGQFGSDRGEKRYARALTSAATVWIGILSMSLSGAILSRAAQLQEDFTADPTARGWGVSGDAALFRWNADRQHLEVTWDSSRPNSYFYHRLPTVLAKSDDFALAFDLRLVDVQVGVTPGRPFTFQMAIGFLNLAEAAQTNFWRGSGINPMTGPRNLVEFDYFPDSGFGATISPTMISSNNQFAVGFDFPLELTPEAQFHVTMRYTAAEGTLRTSMTRDGELFGPIKDVKVPANFSDFRLDAVAMSSFHDAGADGSIRALGVVDNVKVEIPDAPLTRIAGGFDGDVWQVQFTSRTNWVYTLEASENLKNWQPTMSNLIGTGDMLTLRDDGGRSPFVREARSDGTKKIRFYRVRADRL